MAIHDYCDGVRRRDFLKVGVLGGVGLSLSSYLRMAEAGEDPHLRQGNLGDLYQSRRRSNPHGHVRPEAGRPRRIPR